LCIATFLLRRINIAFRVNQTARFRAGAAAAVVDAGRPCLY
jgi:hypothetical protein